MERLFQPIHGVDAMRPVGKHIRACLEASEQIGTWATARDLYRHAGMNLKPTVCTKVMRRAVHYGLAEIDESCSPYKFKALIGWRRRIDTPHISNKEYKKEYKPVDKPVIPRINSVWALAA